MSWTENDGELYSDFYPDSPGKDDRRRQTGDHDVEKYESERYNPPEEVEPELTYFGEYSESASNASVVEIEPVPVRRQPQQEYAPPPPVDYEPQSSTSGMLSMQERQQLLMHTIQLYDDEWKLAGIRANQRKNWLQGYLTPRNKKIELKEAISRNYVLIITIDNRGNTNINEPRKPSLWRRLMWWIFGG